MGDYQIQSSNPSICPICFSDCCLIGSSGRRHWHNTGTIHYIICRCFQGVWFSEGDYQSQSSNTSICPISYSDYSLIGSSGRRHWHNTGTIHYIICRCFQGVWFSEGDNLSQSSNPSICPISYSDCCLIGSLARRHGRNTGTIHYIICLCFQGVWFSMGDYQIQSGNTSICPISYSECCLIGSSGRRHGHNTGTIHYDIGLCFQCEWLSEGDYQGQSSNPSICPNLLFWLLSDWLISKTTLTRYRNHTL